MRLWPPSAEHYHRLTEAAHEDRVRLRREAMERWSGALSDCYDPDYLATLREDWPA